MREAIKLSPQDVEYWLELGEILEKLGKLKAAENAYRKATRANPSDPVAWRRLAMFFEKRGREKEARKALRKAKALESREINV